MRPVLKSILVFLGVLHYAVIIMKSNENFYDRTAMTVEFPMHNSVNYSFYNTFFHPKCMKTFKASPNSWRACTHKPGPFCIHHVCKCAAGTWI